jgi:hypothetical protein
VTSIPPEGMPLAESILTRLRANGLLYMIPDVTFHADKILHHKVGMSYVLLLLLYVWAHDCVGGIVFLCSAFFDVRLSHSCGMNTRTSQTFLRPLHVSGEYVTGCRKHAHSR